MIPQKTSAIPSPEQVEGAHERPLRQRARIWSAAVLSLVILIFGLWTAAFTARIVYTTHSPVIYLDQWSIVQDLQQSNGAVSLPLLWAQHNEHRIPVGRVALIADLRYFSGRNVSLLLEIYLVQLALVLLFTGMCSYFGNFRGAVLATAVGFLSYCMFCPIQIENFIAGFQIVFVFAGFAAALSFACVVWHAARVVAGKATVISWPLMLAFLAAFLAECSLADGLLVWPIIVLLSFSLRLPKPTQILNAAVGLIAVGIYFVGYHAPPQHANPWATIQQPFLIAKYVVTYFGSTWDSTLPSFSRWPTVSESVTVLAIAFVLAMAVWSLLLRRSARDPLRTFLIANLLYTIAAAVLTSLGRINFGLAQATSSRYQSIALVFWASLAALILESVPRRHSYSFALLGAQMVFFILMIGTAGRFVGMENAAKQHQDALATAYAALAYDPPDMTALKPLYPVPQMVPVWYAYLRAHNLGPDVASANKNLRPLKTVPNWGGYHVVAMSNCSGYLDAVNLITPDRVRAQGWAWDITAKRAPAKIVLALPSGLVVGSGQVGVPRADVKAAMKIPDSFTGWDAEAVVAHGSQLQAFAVLADAKSICPLGNELKVP